MLDKNFTWRDVLSFARYQKFYKKEKWIYIITGKPGPTGKTHLCEMLKLNGHNAIEISESINNLVDYNDDENHYHINFTEKQMTLVLNKRIYKSGPSPWNGRNEVGPAWDGFRAGVAEAEREIHGGFVKIRDEFSWDENRFKEWIKKNPHTDITTLYPKTHFILPLSQQKLKPKIKNVIFNNPATIVFWSDGTKTVVKCQEGESFDPEKGLAMAISKKALGNNREYYHTFLHWMKKLED